MTSVWSERHAFTPHIPRPRRRERFFRRDSLEVATLWLVTEHLPNNQDVIEGVFEWTEPGQLLVSRTSPALLGSFWVGAM